jgi:D-alanine-D-alanine ligase
VLVTVAGVNNRIDVLEAEFLMINGKDFFEREIFSYEVKKEGVSECKGIIKSHLLTEQMRTSFISLFNSLGKVEVMRIDGRINADNEFVLLELSPDTHFGERWSTASAFRAAGYEYIAMLEKLISNALE